MRNFTTSFFSILYIIFLMNCSSENFKGIKKCREIKEIWQL